MIKMVVNRTQSERRGPVKGIELMANTKRCDSGRNRRGPKPSGIPKA
jgi:hypothetical protein